MKPKDHRGIIKQPVACEDYIEKSVQFWLRHNFMVTIVQIFLHCRHFPLVFADKTVTSLIVAKSPWNFDAWEKLKVSL